MFFLKFSYAFAYPYAPFTSPPVNKIDRIRIDFTTLIFFQLSRSQTAAHLAVAPV